MFKFNDFQLILAVLVVVTFGFLIHQSVSPAGLNLQVVHLSLGFLLALLVTRLDLKSSSAFRLHLYLLSCLLLISTLIIGAASRGSTRWLDLGPLRFQPSELAKPLLILSFASSLAQTNLRGLKHVLRATLPYGLPLLLIFLQPDFGTVIIITLILSGMLFASGLRLKHIAVLVLITLLISPLLWLTLKDYQKSRVLTFVNPAADPLGKGYNSIQSVIAVGSGQLTGRGLGHGTQTKLRFLPEHRTDFIFASLAEELGFLGSFLLVTAYAWLIIRLFKLAALAPTTYSYLAIIGIATMFASQTLINIGMNIGLLPVTGITLPLVSSGGTSTITALASLGIAVCLSAPPRSRASIEINAAPG